MLDLASLLPIIHRITQNYFLSWDVQKKNQLHFDIIITFVTTQIYWALRTSVLCRWPIATPSVDLLYSTLDEDRQLDVPGIPAHPLFHCKCLCGYDNDVCLYYVLLLMFTTNRFAVVSLVSQCGLYSERGMFRKVTDDYTDLVTTCRIVSFVTF
jgi:hypothetical protein